MQLLSLQIENFRNLKSLDIEFKTHFDESHDSDKNLIGSHAIIGQNGSGKSNLLEALVTIFKDVDLDNNAAFAYELSYRIRGIIVKIKGDPDKQKRPFVWVDGQKESQRYLQEHKQLLPAHIFVYYSGRNERIETLFQEHQQRFIRRQEISTDEVLSEQLLNRTIISEADIAEIEEAKRRHSEKSILRRYGDDRLRRLFYCRSGHTQLVLLACLLSDDPAFKQELENLNIESLESALFVLKQPYSTKERGLNETDLTEGDPRFWFARGNIVSEFLDKLWNVSWAPIEHEERKLIDFRGRYEKQKQLYLFVPNQEKLRELGEEIGSADSFFRYAEGAYIGDLIEEIRITVKKRDSNNNIQISLLSEGELQRLTVLGLMRITRDNNCLFLLDEPDTHLNPIWKLRYFDDIEKVLNPVEAGQAQGMSQILVTTHDPMMIGGLRREQVYILRQQEGQTIVDEPDEHPQGMGVTGLLKSDLFGLSSTLDIETERRIFRRNELYVKKNRTNSENEELTRLSEELADLGFSTSDFRDPDYALFVSKMAQHRRFRKTVLTPEEQKERDKIADEIINEILKNEG